MNEKSFTKVMMDLKKELKKSFCSGFVSLSAECFEREWEKSMKIVIEKKEEVKEKKKSSNKIEDIKGIYEISGFGKNTGYEKSCQKMLQVGFEWIENNKKKRKKLEGHSYKGIYGIFEPDSKEAKELSRVICKEEPECSGAMHQAVMSHLFFIAKSGIEKWKEEVMKKEDEE